MQSLLWWRKDELLMVECEISSLTKEWKLEWKFVHWRQSTICFNQSSNMATSLKDTFLLRHNIFIGPIISNSEVGCSNDQVRTKRLHGLRVKPGVRFSGGVLYQSTGLQSNGGTAKGGGVLSRSGVVRWRPCWVLRDQWLCQIKD